MTYLLIGGVVLFTAAFFAVRAARAYRARRGLRMVICPETRAPALVGIDASAAGVWRGSDLHLASCTRWPERAGCGQECLREIAESSDGCRVEAALERWYAGRFCVLCRKDLSVVHPSAQGPALLDPATRMTIAWRDIPTAGYPAVLETHLPVCWDCHVAETFRRKYPQLVVDSPAPSGPVPERRGA